MVLKIGLYLLVGLLVQWGWIAFYVVYAYLRVPDDKVDKVMEKLISLKFQLYSKGGEGVSRIIEWINSLSGPMVWLWMAISVAIWPILMAENAAVLPGWLRYVKEVKAESSES